MLLSTSTLLLLPAYYSLLVVVLVAGLDYFTQAGRMRMKIFSSCFSSLSSMSYFSRRTERSWGRSFPLPDKSRLLLLVFGFLSVPFLLSELRGFDRYLTLSRPLVSDVIAGSSTYLSLCFFVSFLLFFVGQGPSARHPATEERERETSLAIKA